jgi:putative component of membrane protein insertase Oxa1/YidC/SpoIIIJ protein YidD
MSRRNAKKATGQNIKRYARCSALCISGIGPIGGRTSKDVQTKWESNELHCMM